MTTLMTMKTLGCLAALAVFVRPVGAQPANPHASETIGTVQQVYDGVLFPGVQVSTFRNIERLYPTRTVSRGRKVYPLPAGKPLGNVEFVSNGESFDVTTMSR